MAHIDNLSHVKQTDDLIDLTDIDIASLPVSKLTGKPVIHFAHANGMPSRVYRTLFTQLEPLFTIEYIPILGFNDAGKQMYPIDNHWRALTNQVIASVRHAKNKHQVPIIGLGHSLGALCTLKAIYKQPDLFLQAVLIDPPMIYGARNFMWHLSKLLSPKMVDKLSPAGISKNRRDVWDSREQASALLKSKPFFKDFDARCFDDYIQYGLKPLEQDKKSADMVTLTIPKDIEVAVFRTNPSWFWLTPNRPPAVPVTLLIGKDSKFQTYHFPQKIKKRLSIPFKLHKGGHMFPLEYPDSVVRMIAKTVGEQGKG